VAERLLAIHAQDWQGMLLAVRARSLGLTAASVIEALVVDRSLVISWLSRGTMHLVRSEDYPWLLDLTARPQHSGAFTRLAQEGLSASAAEKGVVVVTKALADHGPMTRGELRDRLAANGVAQASSVALQLLFLASQRGLIVRGPRVGKEQAFVLVRDWMGEIAIPSRETFEPPEALPPQRFSSSGEVVQPRLETSNLRSILPDRCPVVSAWSATSPLVRLSFRLSLLG
jgi:hypothetical protein